jgi:hypothetical protein
METIIDKLMGCREKIDLMRVLRGRADFMQRGNHIRATVPTKDDTLVIRKYAHDTHRIHYCQFPVFYCFVFQKNYT